MEDQMIIKPNKDNDRKILDTIQPKDEDEVINESTNGSNKLEYFTEWHKYGVESSTPWLFTF